jgi:hydroxymethylbilane synthase
MIQTQWVAEQLRQDNPELEVIIKQIQTTGDSKSYLPLTQMGGDGIFVMEIEHALLQGTIDLAVHSLKDLPTTQPEGLSVSVVGEREDVRDVLVVNSKDDLNFWFEQRISQNMRIGTCSLRRSAQIRSIFPRAEICPLRGNVETRLRKLDAGEYDGIILAAAGLHRLGKQEELAHRMNYLPVELMTPAPGQGALALECRNWPDLHMLIAPLKNNVAHFTTSAERTFLRRFGVGCTLPIAAYAALESNKLQLIGLIISLDGQRKVHVQGSIECTSENPLEDAEQLGTQLAEQALSQGAAEIIETLKLTQFQRNHNA